MAPFPTPLLPPMYYARTPARYAVELLIIGGIYFVLAKIDWALGAPYTFSPISLAPGFGLGSLARNGRLARDFCGSFCRLRARPNGS